jgi:CheY-like chemotaxis protein
MHSNQCFQISLSFKDRNNGFRIKKILIIDDEERLRALISRILELEGYKVYQAGNGKQGLQLLEKEDILVVLSDVKLPDCNGRGAGEPDQKD